jgi:hypothetical protein
MILVAEKRQFNSACGRVAGVAAAIFLDLQTAIS